MLAYVIVAKPPGRTITMLPALTSPRVPAVGLKPSPLLMSTSPWTEATVAACATWETQKVANSAALTTRKARMSIVTSDAWTPAACAAELAALARRGLVRLRSPVSDDAVPLEIDLSML